ELLEHVVVAPVVEAEPDMVEDRLSDAAELLPARQEVTPDVAIREARDQVDEAIDHEDPGEEEKPTASGGEVLVARDGHPAREGAHLRLAFGAIGEPEDAGGGERHAEDGGDALGLAVLADYGPHLQDRIIEIRLLADVERRVRVEDLQPAH